MRLGLLKVSEQQTGLHWQHQIDGAVETARLADQLGFMEAYFDGPYVDVTSDRTPGALLLAKLADTTENLRVGIDVDMLGSPMSHSFAHSVSLLNQLLERRLFLGLTGNVSQRLEQLLAQWRTAPSVAACHVKGCKTQEWTLPVQSRLKLPHPDILALIATKSCAEVDAAAFKGFHPVSASWLCADEVAGHWPAFVGGATRAGPALPPGALPAVFLYAKMPLWPIITSKDRQARTGAITQNYCNSAVANLTLKRSWTAP